MKFYRYEKYNVFRLFYLYLETFAKVKHIGFLGMLFKIYFYNSNSPMKVYYFPFQKTETLKIVNLELRNWE